MKLGTKLTFYISLIIVIILSGYGYFHVISRRDILTRKMKVEVRSMGRTLKVSLEKISLSREMEYIQDLIDAVEEDEKTLGVIIYHLGKDLIYRSKSLTNEIEPYITLIKNSIIQDMIHEDFSHYRGIPVFSYTFPLKDRKGKNIGGVSILQRTSFMEDDIKKAKWNIFITIIVLIAVTITFIYFGTKRWISQPISELITAIRRLAKGDFSSHLSLKRGDEISELAHEFNQMATELKKAREEIIEEGERRLELERVLRQSEKLAAVGQLASGLAHEIGTPLNIIIGRADLTKKRIMDSGLIKNLDIIVEQGERIKRTIQHLLGFVRKKRPEQKMINLDEILHATLDLLYYQMQRQNISVEKNIEPGLYSIVGDPDQIQQVFLNIIVNGIQAMPKGGKLVLSATSKLISKNGLHEKRYVEISIADTGVGMEKEVIQSIFEPFYTTKHVGTGLGLTVSHGIVQDHEGWIEVESEVGKGSLFKIYFPCYEGER